MQLEFRQRLLASTLLISAAAFAQPAFAQTGGDVPTSQETTDVGDPAARLCAENPNSPECAAEGQAIVVTGSRIASPTLTSASPLQVVDSADIDQAGVVNVQEVLLENPAFGTPGISRTNSNFTTTASGVAQVDLRNLGSDRTLVLVNGRRFVGGLADSPSVDLNSIPTQFIERIDILTGGASSIYGSDAVAGVVNIIYKDDFEGVELNGQLGISERGDDTRKQANLLMGTNFADGRGNIAVHLGYTDEGAVFTRNRSEAAVDQTSCYLGFFGTDVPNDLFTACRPTFSASVPQGIFTAGTSNFSFNPLTGAPRRFGAGGAAANPGLLLPGETTLSAAEAQFRAINCITRTAPGSAVQPIPNCTPLGFNRSAFRTIAIPTERYLVALRGNYEINDNISVFTEGTYSKTKTVSVLEPFPFSSSGVNGTHPATGGRFNIEQDVTISGTGALPTPATNPLVVSCVAATRVCRVRNPLVPIDVFNAATDVGSDADSFRDISFTQRLSSFGNRGATNDRQTFRVLAGLEGDVFTNWRWDAFYSFGETTQSQTSSGLVNTVTFREALDVIPDVNDIDADGDRQEPICADPQARSQGCAPANVYGAGQLSPRAISFIRAPAFFDARITQKVAGANISGNLFDPWGAGPWGLALGTEYRKESSESRSDALTVAGLNAGNARPDVEGQFDVIEGYAELIVPILSDTPFFDVLNFRAAGRISDYSSVGTTYSYNAGLEWAPVPDVRFRGVYARAVRAPNIGELFTAPSQTFPTGLVDPCEGIGATGNAPNGGQGAICRADPGIAAAIAQNGTFTLIQADRQGISGFNSGNPDLDEEKSDSYTLGVIINPRSIDWLRNFAFTADYFNIKIEDAIVGTPRQFILNQCYILGNAGFCDPRFVTRRPAQEGQNSPGSIRFLNSFQTNSGGFSTEGMDFTMSYRQNLENWGLAGNINARLAYTHTWEGEIIPLPGSDPDPFIDELGAPRHKVFGSVAYTMGEFTGTFRGTWIDKVYLDDQFIDQFRNDDGSFPDGITRSDFSVPSEFLLDMQLRWAPGDNYEFYVGVDNLLDNNPPLIPSGLPGNSTGTETFAGDYDVIGRRFYAGATLKF
ncbi:MAG TPA: TonB-dependent receptor [Allosphingosinicella sp.]|jgi:outer membrane receptor protein involved in Fe transport